MKDRYLTKFILDDLEEKMVFIGGARQVGKTTLAKDIIGKYFPDADYINWDAREHRKRLLHSEFSGSADLLIFDEIHKYKNWKNYIKGVYDQYRNKYRIIVTGSARLNIYRRGGDSLLGRYRYYNLHPFSLAEMAGRINVIEPFGEIHISGNSFAQDLGILDHFGGFPEILIKQSERSLRRWHKDRIDRVFREDIRDISMIRDIGNALLLAELLPEKVGAPLSINALREDLEVSHRAVSSWIEILEQFYYLFRIYPYHKKKIRSLKKEAKMYLSDWSEIKNNGARFENLVAMHLLKLVHFLSDYEGYNAELFYLRNVDKKEVDFLVCIDGEPWFCVETKLSEKKISPALWYFKERLDIPFVYQLIKTPDVNIFKEGIQVVSADRFLISLV